jgi:endonuclease I
VDTTRVGQAMVRKAKKEWKDGGRKRCRKDGKKKIKTEMRNI